MQWDAESMKTRSFSVSSGYAINIIIITLNPLVLMNILFTFYIYIIIYIFMHVKSLLRYRSMLLLQILRFFSSEWKGKEKFS